MRELFDSIRTRSVSISTSSAALGSTVNVSEPPWGVISARWAAHASVTMSASTHTVGFPAVPCALSDATAISASMRLPSRLNCDVAVTTSGGCFSVLLGPRVPGWRVHV